MQHVSHSSHKKTILKAAFQIEQCSRIGYIKQKEEMVEVKF